MLTSNHITLSSSFDELVQALATGVQAGKGALFTKHVVCLPDLKWKRVLTDALLAKQKVPLLAGVSFQDLAKLLFNLMGESRQQPINFPPKDALALHILALLEQDPTLFPQPHPHLISYSLYYQTLSGKLADAFISLGKYGGQVLTSFLESESAAAQLFKKVFAYWDYPYQVALEGSQLEAPAFHLHLFNFAHIPAIYQKALEALPNQIEVSYYQFSYSHAYWTDTLSDAQAVHMLEQATKEGALLASTQDLHRYVFDRNPLLANFGLLHLHQKKGIENSALPLEERTPSFNTETLLGQLQDNIAKNEGKEQARFNVDDTHLTTLSFASRRDEVAALRRRIEQTLKGCPEMTLASISVYAPNMELYKPIIEEMFSEKACPITYTFFDEKLTESSPLVGALSLLLLTFSRPVTHASLFDFFSHPLVQHTFSLSEEEVARFSYLLESAGFSLSLIGSEKSFEAAVKRVMKSALTLPEKKPIYPLPFIGKCDMERLAYFADIVLEFGKKAEALLHKKGTLKTFYAQFLELLTCFGELESHGAEGVGLKQVIELASKLDGVVAEHEFNVDVLIHYLMASFNKMQGSNSASLNTVVCRHLGLSAFYPTPVVFVLGLSRDEFPRIKASHLPGIPKNSDFSPTPTDEDRALFLSLIMQTPVALHLSYSRFCEKEGVECHAAHELVRLSQYVFDEPPYAQPKEAIRPNHYTQAKWLADWQYPSCSLKGVHHGKLKVSLQEIREWASHPIRHYFRSHLGVRLPFKGRDKEERVPYLLKQVQGQQHSQTHWHEAWDLAKKQAMLPTGRYFDMGDYEVRQDREHFIESLQSLTIDASDLFSLTFNARYEAYTHKEETLYVPPASIELEGVTIKIEGHFDHLCKKGLLLKAPRTLEQVIKHSAQIFTFFAMDLSAFCEKRVWFLDKGEAKALSEKAAHYKAFFSYFMLMRHTGFPLLPKWSPYFEKQDSVGLEKAIEKAVYERLDPYINHAFIEVGNYLEPIIDKGSKLIDELFTPLLKHD